MKPNESVPAPVSREGEGEGGEFSGVVRWRYLDGVLDAARAFCGAHKEDYETLRGSDSMDVDAEFMLLYQAVFPGTSTANVKAED